MTVDDLKAKAERNDDGDLVIEREGRFGETHETNLTKLFQPGVRKTSDPRILKVEAKNAADPDMSVGNPAFPESEELADKIVEWCEDNDLEPAWLDGPAKRDDL